MRTIVDTEHQTIDKDQTSFSYLGRVLVPGVVIPALLILGRALGWSLPDKADWPNDALSWLFVVVTAALTTVMLLGQGRRWFVRWPALALGLLALAHFADATRIEGHHGLSIVQVELAANRAKVRDQCDCAAGLKDAIPHDYPFIVAYVVLLVLLVAWASCYYRLGVLRDRGTLVIGAVVAAGVLDFVEDRAMLNGLGDLSARTGSDLHWQIAATCAWAKFAILLAAIAYIVGGVLTWWVTPPWVRIAAWNLYGDSRKQHTTHDLEVEEEHPKPPIGGRVVQRHDVTSSSVADRPGPSAPSRRKTFGIALSGGGIRASSITLGALQVLEAVDAPIGWDHASTVTAVSGGSNMAAGWSIARSVYQTDQEGDPGRVQPGSFDVVPWVDDDGTATPEERHLAENLGYLLLSEPRGSSADRRAIGDVLATEPVSSFRPAAIATVISGLAVNTAVLLAALWAITRPAGWLIRWLVGPDPIKNNRIDAETGHHVLLGRELRALVSDASLALPGTVFLLTGFALLLVWVFLSQFLLKFAAEDNVWGQFCALMMRALKSASYGLLALGAILLAALWGYVALVGLVPRIGSGKSLIAALTGAAGVAGSLVPTLRKPLAKLAPKLGGIAFIAVGLILAAVSSWKAAEHGVVWHGFGWNSGYNWLAALGLLALVQLLVSPELWALASFYRGKLRLAYATRRTPGEPGSPQQATPYRNDNATLDPAQKEPSLSSFRTGPGPSGSVTTPFVVCATATVSTPAVRTHFGTPALSVTFNPEHVTLHFPNDRPDHWSEYQVPTHVVDTIGRAFHKRMTTMMAVSIASAAVSPAMGRYQIGPTSMLLTFFNVRLGVWIANPRYLAQLPATDPAALAKVGYARTGLSYLFREFFGIHSLDDPYLYLTDGGHWENTGLVEMLRNPAIREVVCVDADSGPGDAVSSLTKAIKIAQPECGVNIDISLDPIRTVPSTSLAPAYAPRAVNLGFFTEGPAAFKRGDPVGVLWYSRPALTATMPQRLLAFHEGHVDYPRASTLNQFFDVATFQAYRDLGRDSTDQIVEARKLLVEALASLLTANPGGPDPTSSSVLQGLETLSEFHWVYGEVRRGALAIAGRPLVKEFCESLQASLT